MRRLASLAGVLLVAGCAGAPGSPFAGGRGRDRPPLPPQAQPTSVIATELAFARAAREEGQWSAYSRFAAPGAKLQQDAVAVDAQGWLRGRANPAGAERWAPREAWSSCDGSAVVVVGTSVDQAGDWHRYTRVWERQQDGSFRWAYTLSLPDPVLTAARREREAEDAALGEDAIRVEAGNFIRAKVAGCTPPPPSPAPSSNPFPATGLEGGAGLSKDRTLAWSWADTPGTDSIFVAYSWSGTEWEPVHSEPAAPRGS